MARRRFSAPSPGDLLLHPAPVTALLVLIVNDHVLKRVWPGAVTGKLSDLTGLFLLPLLLVSVGEIVAYCLRRKFLADPRVVAATAIVVAVLFAAAKLWIPFGNGYGVALGWVRGFAGGSFRRVIITHDPTDIAVLPAAMAAWWFVATRSTRSGSRWRPYRRTPQALRS